MPELHDALVELAADARWPATPELAAPVRAAIEAPAAPRRGPRAWWRRGRAVATAAARRADRARRRRRRARRARGRLGPARAPGAAQRQRDAGAAPAAGRHRRAAGPRQRYTLADARRIAGFALLRPAALGAPREVYVDDGVVTFAYRARSGKPILFTQVPGSAGRYVQKFVTESTLRVRIGGRPGLLLRGPHVVFFDDRGDGGGEDPGMQEARLAKNTLMWERDGLLLRLEAEQPARELVRLARSVRGPPAR